MRTRTVLVCLLLAAAIPFGARHAIGPPGALVHIRWAAFVDEPARRALEVRFHLAHGIPQDERTWRYDLRDTTHGNIAALIRERTVEDTHYIDRAGLSIDDTATRTDRPARFTVSSQAIVRAADAAALLLLVISVLLFGNVLSVSTFSNLQSAVAFRGHVFRRRVGGVVSNVARSLERRLAYWVPEIDDRALGAFRLALGCGFVWVALSRQLVAVPLEQQSHRAFVDFDLVHRITASATACHVVEFVMLAAAVLFAVGVRARVTYAVFLAAFALSTLITLEYHSAHDLGLPLVTYIGWLTVPWGAGRVLRTERTVPHPPQRSYGFALWWPGLTLGLALLAAAYWKLHESGLAWITGGAVKYHFVTDAAHASVDWGLWIAVHHWAAVFFSLGAIVMEAVFIVNVFARGPWARLAAGAFGATLYVGLFLLQGIYWPAWHVLFMAFLPWSLLNASPAEHAHATVASARSRIRVAQGLVVVMLVGAQVYASATGTEAEPLMSHFPMYAKTFESIEQFEASMQPAITRVSEVQADGRDISSVVLTLVDEDRLWLMHLTEHADAQNAPLTERAQRNRRLFCERFQRELGTLPTEITFTVERTRFDWTRGRFREYQPVPTVPVPLASICQRLAHAPSPL